MGGGVEVATDSVVAGCERRAGECCRWRMGFRRLGGGRADSVVAGEGRGGRGRNT